MTATDTGDLRSATLSACSCPVPWETLESWSAGANDALNVLHSEWVRCFAAHAISDEDIWLVQRLTLNPEFYIRSSDEDATVTNILERRHLAEADYMSGIGRLNRIRFLRPSEHGKHYSVSGPKAHPGAPSYFYLDAQPQTFARLFWDWFDDTFLLETDLEDGRDELKFLRDVSELWSILKLGRKLRIAVNAAVVVGEQANTPLRHLALDLNLETGVCHAYPITEREAVSIMNGGELRPIKPAEDLSSS